MNRDFPDVRRSHRPRPRPGLLDTYWTRAECPCPGDNRRDRGVRRTGCPFERIDRLPTARSSTFPPTSRRTIPGVERDEDKGTGVNKTAPVPLSVSQPNRAVWSTTLKPSMSCLSGARSSGPCSRIPHCRFTRSCLGSRPPDPPGRIRRIDRLPAGWILPYPGQDRPGRRSWEASLTGNRPERAGRGSPHRNDLPDPPSTSARGQALSFSLGSLRFRAVRL